MVDDKLAFNEISPIAGIFADNSKRHDGGAVLPTPARRPAKQNVRSAFRDLSNICYSPPPKENTDFLESGNRAFSFQVRF
jgi:hypothetical protein